MKTMENRHEEGWSAEQARQHIEATRRWMMCRKSGAADSVPVEAVRCARVQSAAYCSDAGDAEQADGGAGLCAGLPVLIERMRPGAYGKRGERLAIAYDFVAGPWGTFLVAATKQGLCRLTFAPDSREAVDGLTRFFPQAVCRREEGPWQRAVGPFLQTAGSGAERDWRMPLPLRLHLLGTDFQIDVWRTLTAIPQGGLLAYGDVAAMAGTPGASRAAGTAIGLNPVVFFVPCHRVIRATGDVGGFHWGLERKRMLLDWEKRGGVRP